MYIYRHMAMALRMAVRTTKVNHTTTKQLLIKEDIIRPDCIPSMTTRIMNKIHFYHLTVPTVSTSLDYQHQSKRTI